jgi:nucleoid DNA-binding protein
MQLTKHISALLYRYDCVTIPGFGAFLGTPSSAEFDSVGATIYPPTKTISFNAQLQSNDGLLANAIAVAQQTTYEQAVRLVHKEVVRWKSMLHDGQTIELDRIGKLHFNTEQNVVFVPTKEHNHLADSFGLDPVKVEAIDRMKILKGTPKVIDFNDQNHPNSPETQSTNSNPELATPQGSIIAHMFKFRFGHKKWSCEKKPEKKFSKRFLT